jgi:hypothetical protein
MAQSESLATSGDRALLRRAFLLCIPLLFPTLSVLELDKESRISIPAWNGIFNKGLSVGRVSQPYTWMLT